MAHTLITFLGNVPAHSGGQYRETLYALGGQEFSCRFLGSGLAEALKVQRVRILGTSGSMWDVLADDLGATQDEDAWLELSEAVRADQVTPELLQRIEKQLNQAQPGRQYELRLIPYGYEEGRQVEIMRALSEGLDQGTNEVTLDITHGFRHLPMLGLLGMFYVHSIGHARLSKIYYGAFVPGQPVTQVVDLSGLLHIQEWIRSLEQYDKDGDYGVFAELLGSEGMPGHLLAEAAFLERTGNLRMARNKLNSFWTSEVRPRTPASQMFLPLLQERLNWRRSVKHSEWERKLANEFLRRRDYLRAALFAYEYKVSQQVELTGSDLGNFDDRGAADKLLQQDTIGSRHPFSSEKNFFALKFLRNQLAHGVRATVDSELWAVAQTAQFIQSLTSDEKKLQAWLKKVLE
jgi:CRISPR-associated Csx2 family protein